MGVKRVVFDLDGCLSDDRWRQDQITEDADLDLRYKAYHSALFHDKAENRSLVYAWYHRGDCVMTIVTGRPAAFAEQTKTWLQKHFPEVDGWSLNFRPSGNHLPATHLKRDIVENMLSAGDTIAMAYDDRLDIVRTYLGIGVPAKQLTVTGGVKTLPEKACGAAELLSKAATTFRERNAIYKDNWRMVGKVMAALHPDGFVCKTQADHELYHMWSLLIGKITRFASTGMTHIDSVHDACVYAAMIESVVTDKAEPAPEKVLVECLQCSSQRLVPEDQFHGHERCDKCEETTNHIQVKLS